MYPPPSGRHAMRSLYGIGRDGWVWDMSITQWLDMGSSHEVGECSVTVVCPLAGVYSDRPCHEIIVVVVVVVGAGIGVGVVVEVVEVVVGVVVEVVVVAVTVVVVVIVVVVVVVVVM